MAQDLIKSSEYAQQLAELGVTPEELKVNEAASLGITESFPILSIKGKEWTLKFQGLPKTHLNAEGEPARSITVVIIKPSPIVQKTFWKGGFDEKKPRPPDCKSSDGIQSDPGPLPDRQSKFCVGCPMNAWDSGPISGKGAKAKACGDSKALAVFVPPSLLPCPPYRAVLLRLPPTSLKNLKEYSERLRGQGVPINRVETQLTFQPGITQTMVEFGKERDQDGNVWDRKLKFITPNLWNTVIEPLYADATTERMLRAEIRHDDAEDIVEQQRIMRRDEPEPTGFESFGGPEPGPTQPAPEPVQAKAEPAPAPKLVKTKDGRWFDPVSKKFVEPEKPKAKRPENLIEAEDGSFIDPDTGEVYPAEALPWEDEKPAVKAASKAAPESPADSLEIGAVSTPAQKAEAAPTDLAEAKARRSRKGPAKEAAPPKEVPASNGNAVANGNGSGVVVTDTTQEVADALSELFPGGVPGE